MDEDKGAPTPPPISAPLRARKYGRKWERAFLVALAVKGTVLAACEISGADRSEIYKYREESEEFREDWASALELYADMLENEARRRAVEGWDEPVFGRIDKDLDGQVGTIRKFSDTLLDRKLKARRPSLYRERVDVTGGDGSPLFAALDAALAEIAKSRG